MRLLPHLAARGGADRRADLHEAGYGPGLLAWALDRGLLVAHPGWVVALPGAAPDVVVARRLRGVLCDASAARWHDLPVLTAPRSTSVAVGRGTSRRALPGAEVVRRTVPPEHRLDGPPVTTPLATVLDCARRLPFLDGLAVADAAAHRGLVTPDDVLRGAAALSGPGARRAREVARLVDPRCESVLETVLRTLLLELRLPYELQVDLDGVGRVDALVDGRLVVEADGFEHHSRRAEFREDRRRANALVRRGLPLLRLTYEDLVHRRARTLRLLREAATPAAHRSRSA
ncbi:hypothetical protein [Vallicoccus soli]|uniref:DUF559 domain-containing protein n=1 Tax=Vallicoccus soli TaxID=2339232 RepID=A0A3A3Z0Z6_9ACTN|nr:hypothetical protein [Vallicoccus soli]RJK96853.1 hypothetical protein D5H78_06210 [Vallicoccus soli]